jgi:hypothetical protein
MAGLNGNPALALFLQIISGQGLRKVVSLPLILSSFVSFVYLRETGLF